MKKLFGFSNYLILIFLILISFSNCKKDKNCDVVIKVKQLNDSTKIVSDALVKIYVDKTKLTNNTNTTIDTVRGYTDATGEFRTTFKLEAILNVKALKDNSFGQSIITLKEGKTVSKTVLIH
jgi:hypothetical protein